MWHALDDEPMDAGDVGGDIQRGTAFARRFIWADEHGRPLPFKHWSSSELVYALIEETYYAVDIKETDPDDEDAEPIIYDIQNQTELMVCRDVEDPGSTETWCDYEYEYVGAMGFDSLERADAEARAYTARLSAEHYVSHPANW